MQRNKPLEKSSQTRLNGWLAPGKRAVPGWLLALALLLSLLAPAITAAQGEPPNSQIHTTIAGETLPGIAARYGVSVLDLARANNLTTVRSLRAGTRLVLSLIHI